MAREISRRALVRGAVVGGLAAAAAPVLAAQSVPGSIDDTEKKLAKPLTPEAKKLAREALKAVEKSMADRLKTKLPENSEPCIVYIATEPAR